MADHVVSLSATREAALQRILDDANRPLPGQPAGTLTKDDLIRDWVLAPIKRRIRDERAAAMESDQLAKEAAPASVVDQINALLAPYRT